MAAIWLTLATGAMLHAAAVASEPETECYDLKVDARVVNQIPTVIPDCGNDCIITSWPWFLDLKVRHTLDGPWRGNSISALAVQHTYMISHYGTWWLRKNTMGGYNVVRFGRGGEHRAGVRQALNPPKPIYGPAQTKP
jgi:hypothetical protein